MGTDLLGKGANKTTEGLYYGITRFWVTLPGLFLPPHKGKKNLFELYLDIEAVCFESIRCMWFSCVLVF